jgi:hypothetical protein
MIQEKWQLRWLFCYGFAQILHKEGCSTLLLDMNHSARYKFKNNDCHFRVLSFPKLSNWKNISFYILENNNINFFLHKKEKERREERIIEFLYI